MALNYQCKMTNFFALVLCLLLWKREWRLSYSNYSKIGRLVAQLQPCIILLVEIWMRSCFHKTHDHTISKCPISFVIAMKLHYSTSNRKVFGPCSCECCSLCAIWVMCDGLLNYCDLLFMGYLNRWTILNARILGKGTRLYRFLQNSFIVMWTAGY